MNDIKRIRFEMENENHIKIFAVVSKSEIIKKEDILIGDIFSQDGNLTSYSGKNSIQICGFDHIKGPWSCGRFNFSQDCCLVWNDVSNFLKKKNS